MTIITQVFENKAKKILKNIISETFQKYLSELVSTFTMANSSISLFELIKKIICEIYQKAIPAIDNMFLNLDNRKALFTSRGTRERTITTIFGTIVFDRRYYIDKTTEKGFFLIDNFFNFEAYKTYDSTIRGILIDHSVKTNVNETADNSSLYTSQFDNYLSQNNIPEIPRQTIYYWIKNWEIPKIEYDCLESKKTLYIMADEKYLNEQQCASVQELTVDILKKYMEIIEENNFFKNQLLLPAPKNIKKDKHKIMTKCFVTFSDFKTKNGRTELLNRHVFLTADDKPWKVFADEIYNIYNFEEIDNIYFYSDCGSWLLANKNEVKFFKNNKIVANTCTFHVKQYMNRFCKKRSEELFDIIYNKKDKDLFIKTADEIIANITDENKKQKKEKYKKYIIKNWETIQNMKKRDIGSSMEAHISHCVAEHFGSRPKGYSKKNIEKYLKLQEAKENNVNILNLYLNSYNKENKTGINNVKEIFSFENKTVTSNIPTRSSNNPISDLLYNIAHAF